MISARRGSSSIVTSSDEAGPPRSFTSASAGIQDPPRAINMGRIILFCLVFFVLQEIRSNFNLQENSKRLSECQQKTQHDNQVESLWKKPIPPEKHSSFYTPNVSLTLPGYGGWPRPLYTKAAEFHLQTMGIKTGENTKRGHRHHQLYIEIEGPSNALLYIRAYGPAILSALVIEESQTDSATNFPRSIYSANIPILDVGVYTVEAVLTFSSKPDLNEYPLTVESLHPAYEGYLLPGFPSYIDFQVKDEDEQSPVVLPNCTSQDLLSLGRWKLQQYSTKIPGARKEYPDKLLHHENLLGFTADFEYENCQLKKNQFSFDRNLSIVIIGDSNGVFLEEVLKNYFKIKAKTIKTNGGLLERLPSIRSELEAIDTSEAVILFNSGLHDIWHLCCPGKDFSIKRGQLLNRTEAEISCLAEYRQEIRELIRIVDRAPALGKVYMLTPAAWPKWGTYSVAWSPVGRQNYPLFPETCHTFNRIAQDELDNRFPIIDAYRLTHSRPDHGRMTPDNGVTDHLVHFGPEIYNVIVRTLLTMVEEMVNN